LTLSNSVTERVQTFKLIGVVISSDLSWEPHIKYLLSKIAKRIYCIRLLVRAGVGKADIIGVYVSIIRSDLEYACPVWHPGLSKQQSDDIENIQRRCLKILYPSLTYSEILAATHLDTLSERRHRLTREFFNEIKNPDHCLNCLLPFRFPIPDAIRSPYPFSIPIDKPTRGGRSFISYCIANRF